MREFGNQIPVGEITCASYATDYVWADGEKA